MAARLLGKQLGDEDIRKMDAKMLLHPETCNLKCPGKGTGERIIWAFPTYSWEYLR